MHRIITTSIAAFTLVVLNSCETMDYEGPERDRRPEVSIPTDLSNSERRLIGAVEDALADAGYRPIRDDDAEFALEFEVDDGPVNADVHLRLLREGSLVVRSYARTGGPAIIFKRDEMIRDSFDKCLRDFERQLPRTGDYDRPSRRDYDDRGSYGNDDHSLRRGNNYMRPRGYNEEYDRDPRYYQ